MLKRLKSGEEFTRENISVYDIKKILLELAYHDPKAYRMFDKRRLKPKYTKPLNKLGKQHAKAMEKGDIEALNKVLEKYSKVIKRFYRLSPEMGVKVTEHAGKEVYEFEEEKYSNNVSGVLKLLFSNAKINDNETLKLRKQQEKREAAERKKAESRENEEKERAEEATKKRQEENERKEAEAFRHKMRVEERNWNAEVERQAENYGNMRKLNEERKALDNNEGR